ncbi:MAG: hypothetical protein KBS86_00375 [Proteobacteria bacterium]|nr:hypothetical protein [Candidatus Enterousia scatequi]
MRKKSTLGLCNIIRILCITTCAVFIIGINDAMAETCSDVVTSNSKDITCATAPGYVSSDIMVTTMLKVNPADKYAGCNTSNTSDGQCVFLRTNGGISEDATIGFYKCFYCKPGYGQNEDPEIQNLLDNYTCTIRTRSANCLPCKAGTYSGGGKISCKPCTGQQYTDTDGATTYKTCKGTQVANADHTGCVEGCSTSKDCSLDFSGYFGTYDECAKNQSTECSKTCEQTCSGNATDQCPDHATCKYNTAYKTTGTQYYGGSCDADEPCPMEDFTCESGFHKNGNKCDKDVTTITCSAGQYYDGSSCTTCTEGYSCPGGEYSIGGGEQGRTPCEGNTISDAGASVCSDCPDKTAPNQDHTKCVPSACSAGQYLSDGECKSCGTASGVYSDIDRKIPAPYTSNGATATKKADCYLESGKPYYTTKGTFEYSRQCNAQNE